MKNYFLLSLFLLSITMSYAQIPGTGTSLRKTGIGKITGTILDDKGGTGVEFSTISLFLGEDLIDGTITDDKGKFALNELIDGNYKLEISYLGYDKKVLDDIVIEKERSINLGDIFLSEGAATLDEVTVTGERSLIEEKVDRMVYNADQDKLSKGGDAADILRKVPLLTVDLEGNVSLRGNSNITVLINNKPSTIIAANIADALKMLPADMIKTVEVITSPSAKYDAEGSGGIINIITKKNNLQGYYLNLNTGVGLRGSNLGLNGSLRKGKFGMTLGGFGRAFYNKAETDLEQITNFGNKMNRTHQFSDAKDNGIFGRYNLGFDYDIDKTQFLSGGVRYGIRNFSRDELRTSELFSEGQLINTNLQDISSERFSGSTDVNLDYLKVFKPGHEFSMSSLYSRTDENSNFISDNLLADESFINSIKNLDDNLNQEVTLQTDYIQPIGDKQIFEIGGKGILRRVNSDYSYEFASARNDFNADFTRPAGALDYNQNIAAAYTSYTISTVGKYTFKAGIRWERTFIDATQDNIDIDIPDYSNIVPSINVSKTFKDFTTIKLGYNRRIQRPWLRQLNPNVNIQNNQDIQVGNPLLRPELADNIELGISKLIKKTYLNVSFFGRSTDNAINRVRYPIDSIPGAILTTYENIGKEKSLGANIFANINISEKFSINGGVNVRFSKLEGQVSGLNGTTETATNTGWNYGGRLMGQYKLEKGWTVQAFTFGRGRRVELQGTRGGFGMYSIGLNKDFKNKKGSIGLGLENFASRGRNIETELISPTFSQYSSMLLLNRSVRINFSYQFGKVDFKNSRKKTRSVRNDDLMGGDSGNGMQGGGAPQGGGQRSGGRPPTRKETRKAKKDGKTTKKTNVEKPAGKAIDFSGQWKGVAKTPMGEFEQTYTFMIDGTTLTGTIETARGTQELANGEVNGGAFSFEVNFGQFTMFQNGLVVDENNITLSNDRGEMTLKRVQ